MNQKNVAFVIGINILLLQKIFFFLFNLKILHIQFTFLCFYHVNKIS